MTVTELLHEREADLPHISLMNGYVRAELSKRWMLLGSDGLFRVFERRYGHQRGNFLIYHGDSEADAINALLNGDGE